MKKTFTKLLSISLALTSVLLTSCIKQPTASFSVSNQNPKVGETVYFTNNSTDAQSYEWDFGDGSNSTYTNPSHTYTSSGYNYVQLTAYSKDNKKSDYASASVNVKATGDVMFWTDESTVYNITVTFQGEDKTITKYYYYSPSSCGESGCATYENIEVGTYSFKAENLLYTWSGNVTVKADACNKMLLYHAKAEKQQHPENQSTEMLIEGISEE